MRSRHVTYPSCAELPQGIRPESSGRSFDHTGQRAEQSSQTGKTLTDDGTRKMLRKPVKLTPESDYLEKHLSEALGEQTWRDSGRGARRPDAGVRCGHGGCLPAEQLLVDHGSGLVDRQRRASLSPSPGRGAETWFMTRPGSVTGQPRGAGRRAARSASPSPAQTGRARPARTGSTRSWRCPVSAVRMC